MSLDISVSRVLEDGTHEDIVDMNWLRNPFGLERWAETNVGKEVEGEIHLWDVCNRWAYSKSESADRPLFLKVVTDYWIKIQELTQGYFGFGLQGYRQFVEPNISVFPREHCRFDASRLSIVGEKYDNERSALLIPQEYFKSSGFHLPDPSLEQYKVWFSELVRLAEELQDEATVFYCSN